MKRIYSSVMLLAAAAMAFVSCQKNEMVGIVENEQVSGLTFTSEKPSFDSETKTEWSGNTVQWSKGDKIRVAYTANDVWQNSDATATGADKTAKFYPSEELSSAAEVAKFYVPGKFILNEENTHVFYAVYPSSIVGTSDMKSAPYVTVNIPSVQTPSANSFDAEADLMVASSNSYVGEPESEISLNWQRLVAHAEFTLKEIKGLTEDEDVISITLTAQEGANLVGQYKLNVSSPEDELEVVNGSNILEINGSHLKVDGKNIKFAASFLPCTLTELSVVLETSEATYSKSFSGFERVFMQNAKNTLPINMTDAQRVARETEVTATLTFDDTSKRTTFSTSNQVWEENGITVTNNKSSSSNNVADYVQPVRFYQNSSILVKAPGSITEIVFDCNSSSYATTLKNSISATTTVSSDKVTISFTPAVEEFNVAKLNGQVRMDAVTVTYQPAGGSSENPDTTPELNVTETAIQVDYIETSARISVSTKNLYDIEANAFADIECTSDCDWLAAEWTPEGISYTVSENETDELREAYIQITALDSEGEEYSEVITISQATSYIEVLTIEEFLDKDVNPYMWYQLTGVMSNIKEDNAFGNFDITDESGSVYVYGLTATKQSSNDQSFNELGLRNGDELTLIGTRAVYGTTQQVGGPAYYVDHVAAPYLEVSKTGINVGAGDTSAEFTVDANVEWTVSCANADASKTDNKVTVTFDANETAEVVVYEVVVTSELGEETIVITQAAASQGGDEGGVVEGGSDDFHTISATNTSYVTGKTTAGWNYKNCAIFKGGTSDSSPAFKMIGDASNRALCMNGKTSAVGSITSPTLTTGCGTLKFNYGLPFGDTKIKFKVEIMQNGAVVKTFTINNTSAAKLTLYTHEETINVAGDFQIVFTNLSPSNSTSNKDRTAIWDVEWTGYQN